jgi:hypothetical protein
MIDASLFSILHDERLSIIGYHTGIIRVFLEYHLANRIDINGYR